MFYNISFQENGIISLLEDSENKNGDFTEIIQKHHQTSDLLKVYDKKLFIRHSNKRLVAYDMKSFQMSNKTKARDINNLLFEEKDFTTNSVSSLSLSHITLASLQQLVHLIEGSSTQFIFCLDLNQSEESIKDQLRNYGIIEILLGKSQEILYESNLKDSSISNRSSTKQEERYSVLTSSVKETLSAIIIQRCWRLYKINRLLRETLEGKEVIKDKLCIIFVE